MRSVRTFAASAAVAVLASSCGLLAGPSVSTAEEVQAALDAARGTSARLRVTAQLEVVEAELRAAIEAVPGLAKAFKPEDAADDTDPADELLELQQELARHALTIELGDDHSVRYAAETDGEVWAEVALLIDPMDADGTDPFDLVVQARADLPFIEELFEAPEVEEVIDDARVAAGDMRTWLLRNTPSLQGAADVAFTFLGGELAEFAGTIDPAELEALISDGFGVSLEELLGEDPFAAAAVDEDVLADVAEAFDRAVTYTDFRRDGELSLVDTSIDMAALEDGAALLLDLAEDGSFGAFPPEVLEELQDGVTGFFDEAPAQVDGLLELAFDDAGQLVRYRVDLLAAAAQIGAAVDPDDARMTSLRDALPYLEETGLYLDVAVADIGAVPTALRDADATLTVEEVLAGAAEYIEVLNTPPSLDDPAYNPYGYDPVDLATHYDNLVVRVDDVQVGDCFLLDVYTGEAAYETVGCDEPHHFEVYSQIVVAGPEEAFDVITITTDTVTLCVSQFATFVGTSYEASDLELEMFLPSPTEWEAGERRAACFLYHPTEVLTGSMAGAGR